MSGIKGKTGIYIRNPKEKQRLKKMILNVGKNTRFKKGDSLFKNRKHTEETKKKISQSRMGKCIGKNNYRWKGGISKAYKTGYWTTQYKNWRKAVFERDNYTCQKCGKKGGYLTAHHLKSFLYYKELRFDINNGLTLCDNCHQLVDNYKKKAPNNLRKLICLGEKYYGYSY
jgi:predicted restriction endonuclease